MYERGRVGILAPVLALRTALLTAALLVACEEPSSPQAAPEPAEQQPSPQAAPPSPPPDPLADPFAEGLEPLRPRAWADWPLENVDPTTEFGWRLDSVSGRYEQSPAQWFACDERAYVLAIADGRVREVIEREDGTLELIVDHEGNLESRYRPVAEALVYAGLPVAQGTAIGLTGSRELALELRVDDVAIDPLLILRQPPHRWPALLRKPFGPDGPTKPFGPDGPTKP